MANSLRYQRQSLIKLNFDQVLIDEALSKSNKIGTLKDSFTKGEGQPHGLLAEFAVREHFKDLITPNENIYNNDLIIGGYKVEVKAKKYKQVTGRSEWSIAKTSQHQNPDYYFFVSVNYNKEINNTKEICLAGYISPEDFYSKARFYPKGYQNKYGFTKTNGKSPTDHYNVYQYELEKFNTSNEVQLKLSV